MTRKALPIGMVAAVVFALLSALALPRALTAEEEACSGSDKTCNGTCVVICDPENPDQCYVVCRTTKKQDE
jgi:hypothetical protein